MATLEQQLADAIAAQNALTQAVATYKSQLDSTVAAQRTAYDQWRNAVFITGIVDTELNSYRTICRFSSEGLVSLFRLTISGTTGNFVFGKVLDICANHPSTVNVVAGVNSTYGGMKFRIRSNEIGSGTIAVMRQSGNPGVAGMKLTLTPYAGSAEIYTGPELLESAFRKEIEVAYQ